MPVCVCVCFFETILDQHVDIGYNCLTIQLHAQQNPCLCVNSAFTMAYSTVHLDGNGTRWTNTRAVVGFLKPFLLFVFGKKEDYLILF